MTSRSPTLVTIDTSMRRRSLALAIWRGATSLVVLAISPESSPSCKADQFGDLGRRRQLLAAVEGCEQRHAHQHARGHARKKSARQPARRNLAPVGRATATVRNQRRLVAEFGYDIFRIWHPERLLLPRAGRLVAVVVRHDICLSRRAKSTKRLASAEIPSHTSLLVALSPQSLIRRRAGGACAGFVGVGVKPQCGGNRAPRRWSALLSRMPPRKSATENRRRNLSSQKIQKSSKSLLTL